LNQALNNYLVLTGPESSGKTTTAEFLAKELKISWIPEYSRAFLNTHGHSYTRADLDLMICESVEQRNHGKEKELILDTDEITYYLWSSIKYQTVSSIIEEKCSDLQARLYLLCYPDLPWSPDPLRENPEDRIEIFSEYESYLVGKGLNYFILCGNQKVRQATALKIAKEYFR